MLISKPDPKDEAKAMLIAGEKPIDVARVTGLSPSTITRVKQSLPEEVLAQISEEKFIRLQDLITDHLESTIDTMGLILSQFADAEWRGKQNAQELAASYSVFADKSTRIIEATETANIARENQSRRLEP